MFGKNEIVGKKYFNEANGKYLITSIFYTLQGEGPLAGLPAVFIRLAKCNLACSFCDTYFDSGDWMSLEDVHDKAQDVFSDSFYNQIPDWATDKPPAIILTGGEPTLQNIKPLLESFTGHMTQIESNGILPPNVPDETLVVVSPKVNEKTGKYIKPHYKTLERADCLKFVISADPLSPYHTIPNWAFEFPQSIYISPMNIYNEEPQAAKTARNSNQTSLEQRSTVEEVISFWTPGLLNLKENQANHEWAAQYCIMNGLRLNLQMHLYAGKA